jgi:hypothetical protein
MEHRATMIAGPARHQTTKSMRRRFVVWLRLVPLVAAIYLPSTTLALAEFDGCSCYAYLLNSPWDPGTHSERIVYYDTYPFEGEYKRQQCTNYSKDWRRVAAKSGSVVSWGCYWTNDEQENSDLYQYYARRGYTVVLVEWPE